MPIGLPWGVLVAIISGTFALAVVASLPPSRRAVAVSPVDALAVA
jgi:putative ABC transport system permease protein